MSRLPYDPSSPLLFSACREASCSPAAIARFTGLCVSGVLALLLIVSSLGEKAEKFFGDGTTGETVRDVDAELR